MNRKNVQIECHVMLNPVIIENVGKTGINHRYFLVTP
jgi:hypothetical protein